MRVILLVIATLVAAVLAARQDKCRPLQHKRKGRTSEFTADAGGDPPAPDPAPPIECTNGFTELCGICQLAPMPGVAGALSVGNNLCVIQGGALLMPKTPQLQQCLSAAYAAPPYLWVGVTDVAMEGIFVWADGDPLASDSPQWATGQPPVGVSGDGKDCVVLELSSGLLVNVDCATSQAGFVCQQT